MENPPLRRRSNLKWLIPGMHVKRWLLLLMLGTTIASIGFAFILRDAVISLSASPIAYYATLQFLDRPLRVVLLLVLGFGLIGVALYKMSQALVEPFLRPGQTNVVDVVYEHRRRRGGPKIVAIGGGTGLSALLRGLKTHTDNITAIVTVADDGGSSGRLRQELGLPPPGDFRACIAALSDAEGLLSRLFEYRFGEGMGLHGHSFGNLFIAAMTNVTGSFEKGLAESSRVLAVRGQVLPSTLEDVTLCADLRDDQESAGWQRVRGESAIPKSGKRIERVFLQPDDARAYPAAVKAILDADLIVAGPGSLYTSVLPNLLVDGIARAVKAARAPRVYICNVATQPGETTGFSVEDHVRALDQHVGRGTFTHVLANYNVDVTVPEEAANFAWVAPPVHDIPGLIVHLADLVDRQRPWRHDSNLVAAALMQLYEQLVSPVTSQAEPNLNHTASMGELVQWH